MNLGEKLSEKYLETLKAKAEVTGTVSNSEWQEIVGEFTDFLNKEREVSNVTNKTSYPPLEPKRIAMLISYIKDKGGMGDLRKFRDDVRSKGAWLFWYTVKPKKDPNGDAMKPKKRF